jgi:YD repeat-containing protein
MNVKYKKYIDYIVNDIELPYIKSLEPYGLKQEGMNLVLSTIFNQSVTIKGRNVYNTNNNTIYSENSDGYWYKYEYDTNNNTIYYEDSTGNWYKYEYDTNGNIIYREDADGFWIKYEYDANGNTIYSENSNGDWYKYEYDTNGNKIYYEDSTGYIEDNR